MEKWVLGLRQELEGAETRQGLPQPRGEELQGTTVAVVSRSLRLLRHSMGTARGRRHRRCSQ